MTTPIKEKNINFYYEFDYDKLHITDRKFDDKTFKIYKSNFENNYFDYMSPYDKEPSDNIVPVMNELNEKMKEKSPIFPDNDFKVNAKARS